MHTSILLVVLALSSVFARSQGGNSNSDQSYNEAAFSLSVGNVDNGCPGEYYSIQDAVDAAPSGATITLCPGTYTEDVTVSRKVKIYGFESQILSTELIGTLDVEAGATGSSFRYLTFTQANTPTTARQGPNNDAPCNINVYASSVTISDCSFTFTTCALAIWSSTVESSSDGVTVQRNTFTEDYNGNGKGDVVKRQPGGFPPFAIAVVSNKQTSGSPTANFVIQQNNFDAYVALLVAAGSNITGVHFDDNTVAFRDVGIVVNNNAYREAVGGNTQQNEKSAVNGFSVTGNTFTDAVNNMNNFGNSVALGIGQLVVDLFVQNNLVTLTQYGATFLVASTEDEGGNSGPYLLEDATVSHNTITSDIVLILEYPVDGFKFSNNDATSTYSSSLFFESGQNQLSGENLLSNIGVYHNRLNFTVAKEKNDYGVVTPDQPIAVSGNTVLIYDNLIFSNVNPHHINKVNNFEDK